MLRSATMFATIFVLGLAASACGDDANDPGLFVGTWEYTSGEFRIDCNGQRMVFPLQAGFTETLLVGTDTDLSKNDNAGCMGITFNVDGNVASLAPSPQSCTLPQMGTSTAETYTLTLSADHETLTTASAGTFTPTGAPGACQFAGGGVLTRSF